MNDNTDSIFDGVPTNEEVDALPAHIRDSYRALEADSGRLAVLQDAYDDALDEISHLKTELQALRSQAAVRR